MDGATVQALSAVHVPGMRPRVSITVNNATSVDRRDSEKPSNIDLRSPLEELSGVVQIASREPLTIEHVQISFEGESRVYTQGLAEEDKRRITTLKSRYKFLTQSLDLVDFEISNTTAAGAYLYSTQFRFIISEWATSKSGNAPRQCLTLPPTFCHGPILTDDAEGTAYAQPLIEYNLRVVVALTDPHVTEGIKLYHQLGIPIQAASEVFPPCATEVWFNDFVTKQSHPLRSSIFNFKKYTMNLTTEEPTPVLMVKGHPFETTEVKIRVSVMASPSTVDTQTLTMLLQRIGFKIVPGLRAKTFYSTQPFPKLPVQAILTANGPHRLHDQILKLEEVDRCLTSWRRMETTTVPSIDKRYTVGSKVGHKIYPQRDDPTSPVEWHSEISFTVKLPNDVTPTFCSALTARQYSLIILLKATGVSVENFVLEVPIQFVSAATHTNSAYSPVSTFGPSDVSRREQVHLEQDICKMVYDDQPPRYM